MMTKDEYLKMLGAALAEFSRDQAPELESTGATLEEWNDEFMLSVYENTKDKRSP